MTVRPLYFFNIAIDLLVKGMEKILLAVNPKIKAGQSRKVYCPECRRRLCDFLLSEQNDNQRNKIVTDSSIESVIIIKCSKCGNMIGLNISK